MGVHSITTEKNFLDQITQQGEKALKPLSITDKETSVGMGEKTYLYICIYIVHIIPNKIIFFHECGHAIGTLLSGGRVELITLSHKIRLKKESDARTSIDILLGGQTKIVGGNNILIDNCGHLGEVLMGSFLVLMSNTTLSAFTLPILIAMMTTATALWVKDLHTLITLAILILFLSLLVAILPINGEIIVTTIIGYTALIRSLVSASTGYRLKNNDLEKISNRTKIHPLIWRLLWITTSAIAITTVTALKLLA